MISEEHQEFRRVVRRWAEAEVAPHAAEVDRESRFPEEAWSSYVKNGFVKVQFPEEYGGEGVDSIFSAILIEEIARVCGSFSVVAFVSKLGATPLIEWGSDELKQKYLPAVASGDSQMSYCLSEAGAGSDIASMRATARRDGSEYVLNGEKCWISNVGVSDLYTVFVKTDPEAGHRGISCFLVERDFGVEFGRIEHKMGIRGSPTGTMAMHDVRIPERNRIGDEGQGWYIALQTLDRTRPTVGAQAVGIATGAIDFAASYLLGREQFGHPLAEFQGLQFMLADMATRTEAARLLVYEAMELIDAGDPNGELNEMSAMAKCFASDVAMEVTTNAVQLLGGYGYTNDFPVERFMRDAKITQIYEGTNQVQRLVVARSVLARAARRPG